MTITSKVERTPMSMTVGDPLDGHSIRIEGLHGAIADSDFIATGVDLLVADADTTSMVTALRAAADELEHGASDGPVCGAELGAVRCSRNAHTDSPHRVSIGRGVDITWLNVTDQRPDCIPDHGQPVICAGCAWDLEHEDLADTIAQPGIPDMGEPTHQHVLHRWAALSPTAVGLNLRCSIECIGFFGGHANPGCPHNAALQTEGAHQVVVRLGLGANQSVAVRLDDDGRIQQDGPRLTVLAGDAPA